MKKRLNGEAYNYMLVACPFSLLCLSFLYSTFLNGAYQLYITPKSMQFKAVIFPKRLVPGSKLSRPKKPIK